MHLETWPARTGLPADIGGTNARFALEPAPGRIEHSATVACAGDALPADAVLSFLGRQAGVKVRHAVIAIANPVDGEVVAMTNHHWRCSIQATRIVLRLQTLLVVNDFAALAASLTTLAEHQLTSVGNGTAQENATIGLLGGGMVPRLGAWFAASPFRARFENRRRFSPFTAQLATRVIAAPYPALAGAATLLSQYLAQRLAQVSA